MIPWRETRFQFTSKHQAQPAHGILTIGDDERRFGGDRGDAWEVVDVGRGRWPYRNVWNWGGCAGHTDDGEHVIGLQFGGKWTAGTGATENGLIIDGRLTKIDDELESIYDWDRPLEPWSVRAPDGSVDVALQPRYDPSQSGRGTGARHGGPPSVRNLVRRRPRRRGDVPVQRVAGVRRRGSQPLATRTCAGIGTTSVSTDPVLHALTKR